MFEPRHVVRMVQSRWDHFMKISQSREWHTHRMILVRTKIQNKLDYWRKHLLVEKNKKKTRRKVLTQIVISQEKFLFLNEYSSLLKSEKKCFAGSLESFGKITRVMVTWRVSNSFSFIQMMNMNFGIQSDGSTIWKLNSINIRYRPKKILQMIQTLSLCYVCYHV